MKVIKKLTLQDLEKRIGRRHTSGAVHFVDGTMTTFLNSSVNQIISFIKTSKKEFAYFATF